jgi:beta-phosphoglucomutase-like phosphatase (HAD superfamily)
MARGPHRLRIVTQIRAVIFDLDGTLIDHVGSATKALEGWLPGLAATLTEELGCRLVRRRGEASPRLALP